MLAIHPVVCVDGTSRQLIAETRVPSPVKAGRPARFCYEYGRNGTAGPESARGADSRLPARPRGRILTDGLTDGLAASRNVCRLAHW
jgi:hypothetical protein